MLIAKCKIQGARDMAWRPFSSVSEGSTMPGGRVTAVAADAGQIALFLADRGGGV